MFPGADADLLRRAYAVADHWHAGQTRKSGAPYITHPLAVAILLAEIGMDTTTLVAALLHDTVEDTGLTIGEVKAEFGAEVAVLVDGVTKLDGSQAGATTPRPRRSSKMIVAASIDLRVLVIKLADRVHNLRTLGAHPQAGETRADRPRLDGAPRAVRPRLGLYDYQREMEDLSFANLAPDAYERVSDSGAGDRARPETPSWPAGGGCARGTGRRRPAGQGRGARPVTSTRSTGGPARRRPGRGCGRRRARVVVVVDGTEADCYVALGALHGRWRPIEQRFRDYICMPKYNMYRSLHTAVLVGGRDGEGGDLVGVLIRTPAMDRIASYGVAARIREAGGRDGKVTADMARQADLDWLDRLLAWQPLAEAADFLDGLRADLSHGGIVVFTPAGDPVKLPTGSTAVDFAYAVSPQTAGASVGVLVNGAAQGDGEPPRARPGRRPDRRALRRPARLLAGGGPQRPGPHPPEGRNRPPRGRGRRRRRPDARCARAVAVGGDSLRDLEDDGTAFSAARRLGCPDLDALYEAIGRGDLTADEFLAALALEPADAAGPPVVLP